MLMFVNPAASSRSRYPPGQGAADAADPLLGFGSQGGVDAFIGGDVADAQAAAGAQDPERLGEDARLVGGQVDDAVGDDDVDLLVGQGDVLDVAVQEAGIGDAACAALARARASMSVLPSRP